MAFGKFRFPQSHEWQTPEWCCEFMAQMIPIGCKTILEPTPGTEGNLVKAANGCGVVTAPKDFWTDVSDAAKFDCIIMNPPFSPATVGYKILDRCMTMSGNIIALLPWLAIINSEKRTAKICEFGLKTVYHLPRSTFKGSRLQLCVLEMIAGYREQTELIFLNRPSSGKNL